MNKFFFGLTLALSCWLFSPGSLAAQAPIDTTSIIVEGQQACVGDSIVIAITAENFDTIKGFQFSLMWDLGTLAYDTVCSAFCTPINDANPLPNQAIFTWLSAQSACPPTTLQDGDTLFLIKMRVLDIGPGGISINFGNIAPAEVVAERDGMNVVFPPYTFGGMVTFNDVDVQAAADTITCVDSMAMLTANGMGDSLSFEWFFSGASYATMADTLAAIPGTYAVVATGGNCLDTAFVDVIIDTLPPFPVLLLDDTLDCATSMVTLSADTSDTSLAYAWVSPTQDTTEAGQLSVSQPGAYTFIITNPLNGCNTADTAMVVDNRMDPVISIIEGEGLDCDTDTTFLAVAAPDSINLVYEWQNAGGMLLGQGDTLLVVDDGDYILIVTDTTNQCESTANAQVQEDLAPPDLTISGDSLLSCSQDSLLLAASSITPSVTFEWEDEMGQLLSDSAQLQVLTAGDYLLRATDSLNGCQSALLQTITIDTLTPAGILAVVEDTLTCTQASILLEGNSAQAGLDFSWTDEGGAEIATTPTVMVNEPGTFTLTLFNPANGCDTSLQAIILQDTLSPSLSIDVPAMLDCTVDSVSLSIQSNIGNPQCNWQGIGNDCTIDVDAPGIYIATVTDPVNGCSTTDSVEVVEMTDIPAFNLVASGALSCDSSSITLSTDTIHSGLAYFWLDANLDTLSMDYTLVVSQEGDYTLEVVDTTTSCNTQQSLTVMANTDVPSGILAVSGALNCTDTLVNLQVGMLSPNTLVSWSDGNGSALPTAEVTQEGTYYALLQDTLSGCTFQDSITIAADLLPPGLSLSFDGDSSITCLVTQVGLTASSSDNISVVWIDAQGDTLDSGLQAMFMQPGSYQAVALSNDNGCETAAPFMVAENMAVPMLQLSDTMAMLNCVVSNVFFAIEVVEPNTIYSWEDSSGNVLSETDSLFLSVQGVYTVVATDTLSGCSSTAEASVTQDEDLPQLSISGDTVLACSQDSLSLFATSTSSSVVFEWQNAAGQPLSDSAQLLVMAAGDYVLVATDTVNGCQASITQAVVSDTSPPMASVSIPTDTLTCTQTSILLEGGSPQMGLDFTWQDTVGDTLAMSSNLSVVEAGVYTLVVTDPLSGCDTSLLVSIFQDTLVPSLTIDVPAMLNCAVNSIDLSVQTNVGNAVCSWQGGGNQCTLPVSAPGTYTATVTNPENGCSATGSVEVVAITDVPAFAAIASGNLSCDSATVTLSTDTIHSSLAYFWIAGNQDTLSTDYSLVVSQAGNYTLSVLDTVTSCTAEQSLSISANGDIPSGMLVVSGNLDCNTDTVALEVQMLTPNTTVSWSDENGNTLASPEASLAGIYFALLQDTVSGCTFLDSVEVSESQVPPGLMLTFDGDSIITCLNMDVSLTASSGDDINLVWVNEQGDTLFSGLQASFTEAGTYDAIASSNTNGCEAVVPFSVGENNSTPNPQLNDTLLVLTCTQSEAVLTVALLEPNTVYSWEDENGTALSASDSLAVSGSGQYTLVATDSLSGCSATVTAAVSMDEALPEISISGDTVLGCQPDGLSLLAMANSNTVIFEWQDEAGQSLSGSAQLTVFEAGGYTLLATDTLNGCSNSLTQEVIEDASPPSATLMVEADTLTCAQNSILLEGNSAAPGLQFSWLNGAGDTLTTGSDFITLEAGTFTLVVTNPANGCDTSLQATILQDTLSPSIAISTPDVLTCLQEIVALEVESNIGNAICSWAGIGDDCTVEVSAPGLYTATVSNPANGCTATASVEVQADNMPPVVAIELLQLFDCASNEATISATLNPDYTYEWFGGDGTILSPMEAQTVVTGPGQYNLTVVDTQNGCTAEGSIEVPPSTAGVQSVELDIIPVGCIGSGNSGSAIVSGIDGGNTPYLFSLDGADFTENGSFTNLTAGNYSLSVFDGDGCQYDTIFTIEQAAGHSVALLAAESSLRMGDSTIIFAQFSISESEIASSRIFTASSTTCDSCSLIGVQPFETTIYFVESIDINGCTATASVELRVDESSLVFVPNAFSPNEDGRNDSFKVFPGKAVRCITNFAVFDRWGNQVYEENPEMPCNQLEGWDGTFNGEPLDPAVFVYQLEVELLDGRTDMLYGELLLVR